MLFSAKFLEVNRLRLDLFSVNVSFSQFRPRDVLKGAVFGLYMNHEYAVRTRFERKCSLQ